MSEVQLDLFVDNDARAFPTRRSAVGVVEAVARRLGYDYVAHCRSCGQTVTLAGEWRPVGWVHRDTQAVTCAPAALALRQRYAHLLERTI